MYFRGKKTILTIAASDPSGGAGVQRDIKVFSDFGLTGLSAITALTVQNQKKVKAVLPVPAAFVIEQIDTLLEENTIDVVKLGMLAKAETVMALASLFKKKR
ncbi:MAG TPA: bifunctional hydroxymethylpyrimidine kinase/phosphomethylpyrimidine kinase, partial [Thermodesulfobacteriota bacterium]|nr:bifunctional hydroxymethylpyrimidine kinase/phosphomethylpyrimidine kinase [Thermodesulfobacteriota bacterium]